MKRITMQCAHNPPSSYGDCFRASLASLLGVEADHVPHFLAEGDTTHFLSNLKRWCFDRGLYPVIVDPHTHVPSGLHIAVGFAAGDDPHCVVMDGDIQVHDPRPNGGGLETFSDLVLFQVTEADRLCAWKKSCE